MRAPTNWYLESESDKVASVGIREVCQEVGVLGLKLTQAKDGSHIKISTIVSV